ncbi:30S ribosomal protein S18 [Omnitrophica bacterium]|nr:30S ribosomal protein S18 [Candidatus Omnitrophota bacterium]
MQKRKKTFVKRRPGGKGGFRRRRVCKFCVEKTDYIDYKDVDRLKRFITERGKILPSRISGTCANHQRRLARAIRRARAIALVPYIANYK